MSSSWAELEPSARRIGRELFEAARRARLTRLRRRLDPSEALLRLTASDPGLKERAFRFTALLPLIHADDRRVCDHLVQYFGAEGIPALLRSPAVLLDPLRRAPLLGGLVERAAARTVVSLIERVMAGRFFAGCALDDVLRVRRRLGERGYGVSVDVLGENCADAADAEAYMSEYLRLLEAGVDDVSLKLSAMDPVFDPGAADRTLAAVLPAIGRLLEAADRKGARVTLDMEQYTQKSLTLETVVAAATAHPGTARLSVALQAYVRDETDTDLTRLIHAARDVRRPLGVRLVKGANWDSDTVLAARRGWPNPLYDLKSDTDRSFERLAMRLFKEEHGLYRAFGTHNVRSIAWVLACAEAAGSRPADLEFQFLYGMIPDEIAAAVAARGWPVRYYTPYGQLLPGLAYLVRRLLENSSNHSFLRRLSYRAVDIERQLRPPAPESGATPSREDAVRSVPHDAMERGLREAERLASAAPGVFGEGVRAGIQEARRALGSAGDGVQSLPGELNAILYRSRGDGLVIAGEGADPALLGRVCGVALCAGGPVRLAGSPGVLSSCVGGGSPAIVTDVPAALRSEALAWVCVVGRLADEQALRRMLSERTLERRTPPRWVRAERSVELWPELTAAVSVCENTLQAGFAPEPRSRGGVSGFRSTPELRWHERERRESFLAEGETLLPRLIDGEPGPIVDGRPVRTGNVVPSEDPCRPDRAVAAVHWAGEEEVRLAVAAARRSLEGWARTPLEERSALLRRAAQLALRDRAGLARLIALEVAKPIEEAVREVDEGVDFFNYYAETVRRLPGSWRPRGVTAVISPWNFPFAIPAGMAAAALVTGNTVVFKPAEQSSVTGWALTRLLLEAGTPGGALHLVPGDGPGAGAVLAAHPDVRTVTFTGSREVGLSLYAEALGASGDPRSVIAEMGGKNAIIVDADADPDEAAASVIQSAFGYAGQKCSACSRVIVLEPIRAAFEERLRRRFNAMVAGSPQEPGVRLSALIDRAARERVLAYIERGRSEGLRPLAWRDIPAERKGAADERGYYAPAVVYADVPASSRLFSEEIFGPVLCLTPARDLDEALRLCSAVPYGLTAGVFSQSPLTLTRARRELEVGNLYLNRGITGALVGRQPFGGLKHSGLGTKAGGPDYLAQFVERG